MSNITTVGIDLAKSVFQLCGLNRSRKIVFNKQVKRAMLMHEVRQHPNAIIAMEACSSSHYWARTFIEMGFTVRLIPAQHVKAFVRGNKNDANDALAIAESVDRPNLHEVQVKTLAQQDIQTLLRIRSRYKKARKVNSNQLRGLLGEYGLIIKPGMASIEKGLPLILEDAENGLTFIARQAMAKLLEEHYHLSKEIKSFDDQVRTMAKQCDTAKRLMRLVHLFGIIFGDLESTTSI